MGTISRPMERFMSTVTPSNITWAARAKTIIGEEEDPVFIPGDVRQRTGVYLRQALGMPVKVLE